MNQREFMTNLKLIYNRVGYRLLIDYKSSDFMRGGYIHHAKAHILGMIDAPLYFRGISETGAIYLTDSADKIIRRIL